MLQPVSWKKTRKNVYFIIFSSIVFHWINYSILLDSTWPILFYSPPLNWSYWDISFLWQNTSHSPSDVLRDFWPIWDIAHVQKYSCLIKSSYVPGYVCLNWQLAVCSFFDSTSLFNTYSIEHWLLLTAVWSCEAHPNSINNLCGCLHKRWSI